MRIETACNSGIVKILGRLTEGDLTTSEVCNIILPVVRGGGNDVDLKDIKAAVWDAGLADAMKAVGEILATALGAGRDMGNVAEAVEG